MITKRLIAVCLIAIPSVSYAQNSGFYVGINSGINHGKYSVKDGEKKYKLDKTRFLLEGILGYEHKFTSIVAGINFEFGNAFGPLKKKLNEEITEKADETVTEFDEVNLKSKFHISAMSKIGYRCTPNFNIYLTAGIQYVKHQSWITDDRESKEKKGKVHPVIGIGGRYDFANKLFVKLEYDHLFKINVVHDSSDLGASVKYNCHIVKIGVGYVF
jgi:opacity protein-like surface antigen